MLYHSGVTSSSRNLSIQMLQEEFKHLPEGYFLYPRSPLLTFIACNCEKENVTTIKAKLNQQIPTKVNKKPTSSILHYIIIRLKFFFHNSRSCGIVVHLKLLLLIYRSFENDCGSFDFSRSRGSCVDFRRRRSSTLKP